MRLPGGDLPARIADRLHALDYTVEGVRRLVGDQAANALDRDETVPASRVLAGDRSPLATLVRCLVLGEPVDASEIPKALGVEASDVAGLLEVSGGQARALVDVAAAEIDGQIWWIASDWSSRRTGAPTESDHVLGVGGASIMLAQCTVRPPVEAALDVGTGSGFQAFQLINHSRRVVATDVSERCLEFARFNASLNEVDVDLRKGSLLDPVRDEAFDLVVSNPPFVIGSPSRGHHDYRDFAGAGVSVCEQLVAGVEPILSSGGWCQMLANWAITDPDDWSQQPRQWLEPTGLDAWVIQRDVQDPDEYVETWLRDAGQHGGPSYRTMYDEWLDELQARGVAAIGFGLLTARRTERDVPVRRFQHAMQQWEQPVAHDVQRWFEVQEHVASDPSGILRAKLQLADDVVVEQHGWATGEPVSVLRRSTGMRWSGPVDTFGLEVLAELGQSRPVAEIVAELAARHAVGVEPALSQAIPVLNRLAEEGFVQVSW
jgi:methylase of polypeptide subunit release factors